MTLPEARTLYSDYVEGTLDTETRTRLEAFFDTNNAARADYDTFARTLDTLHRLPAREPVLDLWREFAPHMAAYDKARRLSISGRLRLRWHELTAAVSAGLILWTHSLAARTHARLEPFLLRDPLNHSHRRE